MASVDSLSPPLRRQRPLLNLTRRQTASVLLGLLAVGAALRVLLVVFSPHPYGYIYDFYHDAVAVTWWQRRLPISDECGQCYHPPLFYLVGAPLFGVGRIIHRLFPFASGAELRTLSLLPILCGSACVWYGYRTLTLLRFRREQLVLGTGFLLMLPVLFFSTYGIEADILLAALMTALAYYALRYSLRRSKRTAEQAALLGVLAGLSASTKYSGLVAIPFIAVVIAEPLWHAPLSKATWRNLAVALSLCVALCAWKYVDNVNKYGNPMFANGTALQGFSVTTMPETGHYEFFTFRLRSLLDLTGASPPDGRLTDLPVYRSFWTAMYGMTWNDLGMFSNPTRHGDYSQPYGTRYVPPAIASAVLLVGLVPSVLGILGMCAAGLRRPVRPLFALVLLTGVAYIPWVLRQTSWAIKPKYLLYLVPAYGVFALLGLGVVRRRLPRWAAWSAEGGWIASLVLSAVYLAFFAVG